MVLDGMQGGTAATQDVFIEHVGHTNSWDALDVRQLTALQGTEFMHRKVQLSCFRWNKKLVLM